MAQDAVHDTGIGNKGEDAHAGAAGAASQRVGLENFPDQTSPRAAGLAGEIGIVPLVGGDAGGGVVGWRRLAQNSAAVGIGAVASLAVASRVGNMGGDPVNPFQGIEHDAGGASARVRGRVQRQGAVMEFLKGIHGQGGAGDVAALGFERGEGGGIHGRSGEDRETGMDLGQEIAHKGFREALGPVQSLEEEAAEYFHDRGGKGIEERQELSVATENAVGNEGMGMRIEVGPVAAEGLERDDAAGADVTAVKECLEGFQDRCVSGLGQQGEELAVAFDEAAQDDGS